MTDDVRYSNEGPYWTADEYERCPDLAARLHSRILDLEDAIRRMVGVVEVGVEYEVNVALIAHEALNRERPVG